MLDDAKVGPGMPIWWPALTRAARRVLGDCSLTVL